MERLWGNAADDEEGGAAHPALLTSGADGVLRLWVEVRHPEHPELLVLVETTCNTGVLCALRYLLGARLAGTSHCAARQEHSNARTPGDLSPAALM
jgi:hypothetical protein